METITILREEYERLHQIAAKISIIEEVIHQPELSDEIKEELKKARAVPDSKLIDHQQLKKKLGIV